MGAEAGGHGAGRAWREAGGGDAIGGAGAAAISRHNGPVNQQSAMLAYPDDFILMLVVTLVSAPIVLLLRRPKAQAKLDTAHAISEWPVRL